MKFSVVICAYTEDRWDDLASAVRSAQVQTLQPAEIIVVIDHNHALFQRVKAEFPEIISMESVEPSGLATARNCGVAAACGDIVAFLDDDAVAAPDWLEHLAAAFIDPEVIGAGGEILPLWPAARPRWFPEEFHWVVGCTYRGLPEKPSKVRNLIGANMAFRRVVFEKVTFFPGIGHIGGRPLGGSDPDFCIRVSQSFPGRSIFYQPDALVQHRVSPKRARWDYFRLRCYNEGLSKSLLTKRVGQKDSLSVERSYTLRTLPQGVLKGLSDTLLHADISGLGRSFAILAGLFVTAAGYVSGSFLQRFAPKKWNADWSKV